MAIILAGHLSYQFTGAGAGKSHGDLELRQRSSKSLLANVLDLEDNALASHNNLLNNVYSTPGPHHHTMGHGHSHIHATPHHHHSHAATPHHQHSTPLAHSSYPAAIQIGHTPHHHPHPPETPGPQVETILQNACFCARNELMMILKEIKVRRNPINFVIWRLYIFFFFFQKNSVSISILCQIEVLWVYCFYFLTYGD